MVFHVLTQLSLSWFTLICGLVLGSGLFLGLARTTFGTLYIHPNKNLSVFVLESCCIHNFTFSFILFLYYYWISFESLLGSHKRDDILFFPRLKVMHR
ncbi:hypothetical protein RIF29_38775 [Crotalaria pallida]|uniref:Uncharacterized protein n=1 Tax=Crotalaria pallida TaxID=3830 RepID=A0AAN9HLV7_CROPI